jgi:hypothetical protein
VKRRTPIPRKSSRKRSKSLLAYKRRARFGIGTTRKILKRRKHNHRVDIIAENRKAVFERDRACRRCHRPGRKNDHCHEVISRAMLRGRPAEEIFSATNTLRLCSYCHEIVTRHREDIVFADPELGCQGTVEFQPRLFG